jgi:hypothetical protein
MAGFDSPVRPGGKEPEFTKPTTYGPRRFPDYTTIRHSTRHKQHENTNNLKTQVSAINRLARPTSTSTPTTTWPPCCGPTPILVHHVTPTRRSFHVSCPGSNREPKLEPRGGNCTGAVPWYTASGDVIKIRCRRWFNHEEPP